MLIYLASYEEVSLDGGKFSHWSLTTYSSGYIRFTIDVCHLPHGTSKWNKIEHQMFCHITQNQRGRALTSRQVVVNLISHTTTNKGLKIWAMLDENTYDTGIKASNADINSITLKKRRFHGDWNYQIKPRKSTQLIKSFLHVA